MKRFKIKSYLLFPLAALLFVSCQKEQDYFDTPEGQNFSIGVHDMDGLETRSSVPTTIRHLSYYVADSQGNIIEMPHTSTAPDFSYIRIENLRNGDYRLLVLAESDNKNLAFASVQALQKASDNWLVLNNEKLSSLEKEYYYADHAFRVSNGTISNTNVMLTRVFGKVAVNIHTNSSFAAEGAIQKVEIIPNRDVTAYSAMNGNGAYRVEKNLLRIDITETREFTLLPLPDGSALTGRIEITALTSDGSSAVSVYNFSTSVNANTLSTVTIDYKHPDDDMVGLYVPFGRYNMVNNSRILQDNEPKSVFYDKTKRAFNVKAPLQYGFDDDNKLYIRFYSAVGMSNVRLMWSAPDGETLEFARFDSIPPFFEAHLEHPLSKKGGMIKTQDGRIVKREAIPNLKNAGLSLSIVCNDVYWQKIQAIIPSITVEFSAYGGDPDAANGAPNGNWMGIRPVHIRESCALLTNLFFLVSTDDFVAMMQSHDGTFRGNDGSNIPALTIVNQYRGNRKIIVGLIWTGNGVIGLGGGSTWGLYQYSFFNHYINSETAWHEMSHCLGYGHSSNLTYGKFAEEYARNLYTSVAAAGRMPVSYPSILNSSNNPHRY